MVFSLRGQNRKFCRNFKQQRLRAWQPILSLRAVIALYVFCGVAFIGLGFCLLADSKTIVEHYIDYTDIAVDKSTGVGQFEIDVPKAMTTPIWISYELSGFFQNHRQYVKSVSDLQLRSGSVLADIAHLQDCMPWIVEGPPSLTSGSDPAARINFPCGLVARSIFNDSFVIVAKVPGSTSWTRLFVDSSPARIAWPADANGRYKNIDPEGSNSMRGQNQQALNMWLLSNFPPVQCEQTVIDPIQMPFVPATLRMKPIFINQGNGAPRLAEVPDCSGYMSNSPSCNFLRNGSNFTCSGSYQPVQSPAWGIGSGHFMVWMRAAGLPTFRKLWGSVDTALPAGSKLVVYFIDNFPVKPFYGTKAFVMSTDSTLGGDNSLLGFGFIGLGSGCLFLGVAFLFRSGIRSLFHRRN